MDDDVTVEPTWLHNLTKYLSNGEWAGVGGRTLLADGFSAPSWMLLDGLYSLGPALAALFDLGDEPCELRDPPYGTNMAFHKRMFDKYGGFRTEFRARAPAQQFAMRTPNLVDVCSQTVSVSDMSQQPLFIIPFPKEE